MVDKSNMRQVILDSPKQFTEALEFAKDIKVAPSTHSISLRVGSSEVESPTGSGQEGKFKNIITCGMGGSALPANLLITYLNKELAIPIYVHRSYGLPAQAGNNSLIICISYSGNTEEPISAYEEAVKRKLKVAAISVGEKLGKLVQENGTPWAKIPARGIQPRSGTGYVFTSLVKILSSSGIIEDKSQEILEMAGNLKPLELEAQGKDLAKKLVGKIPLVYASDKFKALSRIWKIKFNENSKVLAFWNYFPELNHNEMVGYTNLQGKFHVVILRDKDDHPRILKRMEITSGLMKSKGAEVTTIDITQGTLLFKIFSTLILGDWVSYYLALEYGVDPTPVAMVEDLKAKLKK